MLDVAQLITGRIRRRPLTAPGRAIWLLSRLDVESQQELEPEILGLVRRMAGAHSRRSSPMLRTVRGMGLCPTDADVAHALLRKWRILSAAGRAVAARSIPSVLVRAAQVWLDAGVDDELDGLADAMCECPSELVLPVLERLLNQQNSTVRSRATERIVELVGTLGPDAPSIDGVLARLFENGPNLLDRAVLSCVLAGIRRPGPQLAALLGDEGHPTHLLLRSLIRNGPLAQDAQRLMDLLAVPSVRPAARDALERRVEAERIAAIAGAAHLLLSPDRRFSLGGQRWMKSVGVASLNVSTLHGFPRLLDLCGAFDAKTRSIDVSPIIVRGDRAARANLAVRLGRGVRPDDRACDALRDLSFDTDPRIARRAMLALGEFGCESMCDVAHRQARSSHASSRSIAEEWQRRFDSSTALRTFDPHRGGAPLRHALHVRRDSTLALFRAAIQAGDADARVAAILWARRLHIAHECELELLAAAASECDRVVATAVTALSVVPTDAAGQAILACLSHANPRVRANAVEAIDRRGDTEHLHPELSESDDPRVRANVARAFLASRTEDRRRRDGVRILDRMMRDDRSEHRRSAMWLTERLARTESAHDVATMAGHDPEMPVRRRARRAARRLLAEMRADILVRLETPGRHVRAEGTAA